MKKKQQPRQWILAAVMVVLLSALLLIKMDNQKLYLSLQQQLAQTGITLQAEHVQLSWMYLGSIRLDAVEMQSSAFHVSAQRIFIDLDLAALLTGKAIAQALYLQLADIDIQKEQQNTWLDLIATDEFKLKRINISQSELYFEEQHLTLEQVDLDIRDIGKNKNPRLELRAHLGEGRLDAHGYLHLKRGAITRGFGRLRLYDIPVAQWYQNANLQTLNGSITTHMKKNDTWQSFGYIAIEHEHQAQVELRGKVTGGADQWLNIEDLVLHIKGSGAVRVAGSCKQRNQCAIDISSSELLLPPILSMLSDGDVSMFDGSLVQDLHLTSQWKDGTFLSDGKMAWSGLDADKMHIDPVQLDVTGFHYADDGSWLLDSLDISEQGARNKGLAVHSIKYADGAMDLPVHFNATSLWLPLSQGLAAMYHPETNIQGQGNMQGKVSMQWLHGSLQTVDFALDAHDAALKINGWEKPQGVVGRVAGSVSLVDPMLLAELGGELAGQHIALNYRATKEEQLWAWHDVAVDFAQLLEAGVVLPTTWQQWHGVVKGDVVLVQARNEAKFAVQQASLALNDFGLGLGAWTGEVKKEGGIWTTPHLLWTSGEYKAVMSSKGILGMDIEAWAIDSTFFAALSPWFQGKGRLKSKLFRLPFGALEEMTAMYVVDGQSIHLSKVKSKFYDGSLRAKGLTWTWADDILTLNGAVQLGEVRLNRWAWMQQQFQTRLEGRLYATLNLQASFDADLKLKRWSGDGDVHVYNAKWWLHDTNIHADSLRLKLRKRKVFQAAIVATIGQKHGEGTIMVDEQKSVSGDFLWQDQSWLLKHDWPELGFTLSKPQ